MYNRVLVAIEDEFFGRNISAFVASHGWEEGTEFIVLHVIEPLPGYDRSRTDWQAARDKAVSSGENLVKEVAEAIIKAVPGAVVTQLVIEGVPKEVILKHAAVWRAEMIVVGSHGRKGIRRLVLGSVSAAVASSAPCSIAIIRDSVFVG